MRRILVVLATVAAAAAVVAAPASATTATFNLSGAETGIPVSVGGGESTSSFAGFGSGSPYGFAFWSASVTHYALDDTTHCGTTEQTGCITGGSFAVNGVPSGTFAGGSISLLSGSVATCTPTVVYAVAGTVDLTGGGTATFNATLTHYQAGGNIWIGIGELNLPCVPYFATVSGSLVQTTP